MKRVRVNSKYRYVPSLWDSLLDPPRKALDGTLKTGDTVKVVNLHGCPKANTMGMCYIATPGADFSGPKRNHKGMFLGLVMTSSLEKL